MKTISVGELRQNPTRMLDDVAAGETYTVTRHNKAVARVVPTVSSADVVPPAVDGPSSTAALTRIELSGSMTVDELL
ncbi:MAG: type II toxin-antitoxin system Phd/YefM family antitoxin, partial [Mobilicoccus sp.]|nr:type II toxin-antitoxin system Phd/YefM family antitoxin [Mobilicoccus sp.]